MVLMLFYFCCSQNLQRQQWKFGDGQRGRREKPSPTSPESGNVILASIENRGMQGQRDYVCLVGCKEHLQMTDNH